MMKFTIGFEKEDKAKLFGYWNQIFESQKWTEGYFTNLFESKWEDFHGFGSAVFSGWAVAVLSVPIWWINSGIRESA